MITLSCFLFQIHNKNNNNSYSSLFLERTRVPKGNTCFVACSTADNHLQEMY